MSKVASKVDFILSYIGTPTDPDDGVSCKHGPTECKLATHRIRRTDSNLTNAGLGNIIGLCAADIYPDPKQYLGFANCMIGMYEHIPEKALIYNCALEHGLSFDKLNECASRDDGHGMGMLRDSVTRSHDAGVAISCTVRLEGDVRCVRDGGEWKNCKAGSSVESLVSDIEALWDKRNGKA